MKDVDREKYITNIINKMHLRVYTWSLIAGNSMLTGTLDLLLDKKSNLEKINECRNDILKDIKNQR